MPEASSTIRQNNFLIEKMYVTKTDQQALSKSIMNHCINLVCNIYTYLAYNILKVMRLEINCMNALQCTVCLAIKQTFYLLFSLL